MLFVKAINDTLPEQLMLQAQPHTLSHFIGQLKWTPYEQE